MNEIFLDLIQWKTFQAMEEVREAYSYARVAFTYAIVLPFRCMLGGQNPNRVVPDNMAAGVLGATGELPPDLVSSLRRPQDRILPKQKTPAAPSPEEEALLQAPTKPIPSKTASQPILREPKAPSQSWPPPELEKDFQELIEETGRPRGSPYANWGPQEDLHPLEGGRPAEDAGLDPSLDISLKVSKKSGLHEERDADRMPPRKGDALGNSKDTPKNYINEASGTDGRDDLPQNTRERDVVNSRDVPRGDSTEDDQAKPTDEDQGDPKKPYDHMDYPMSKPNQSPEPEDSVDQVPVEDDDTEPPQTVTTRPAPVRTTTIAPETKLPVELLPMKKGDLPRTTDPTPATVTTETTPTIAMTEATPSDPVTPTTSRPPLPQVASPEQMRAIRFGAILPPTKNWLRPIPRRLNPMHGG